MCVYRSNTGTSSRRPNTKLTNVQASYQPHHLLYLLVYDQTRIRVSNELGLPNHGNAEHTVHFDLVEVNTTANIPLEASTRERNRKQLRNTVKHCAFPEIQTVVIQRQSYADRHTIEMPPTLQKMFPYLGHTYDMVLYPGSGIHDIAESRAITRHAVPAGVDDVCQIRGRVHGDFRALFFYHNTYVDVPTTLLCPWHFPGKHFPDDNSEAVNVARVGSTVSIKNLNKTGMKSRMGHGAGFNVSVTIVISAPPTQEQDNTHKRG